MALQLSAAGLTLSAVGRQTLALSQIGNGFIRSAICSSLGSVRWSPCFDIVNRGGANKRDDLLRDFEHARLLIAIAIGIVEGMTQRLSASNDRLVVFLQRDPL